MTQNQGWTCPKCSRVWAPHVAACGACNMAIPSFGPNSVPNVPPYRITCASGQLAPVQHPTWNYSGDDISFAHQDGDPA